MKLCKLADKLMLLDDAFSTFILKTSYPEVSWSCCSQKPDPLFTTCTFYLILTVYILLKL